MSTPDHGDKKTSVLVVGAGRRALSTLLPALWCMDDDVHIAGVQTRTVRDLHLFDGALELTTGNDLSAHDFSAIDVIVMAVNKKEVAKVLTDLGPMPTGHITLMMDTPVLLPSQLRAVRHFAEYREVLASEDSIALPPYVVARRLIDEGRIGELRRLVLFHSGYRHHGLASLKYLADRTSVRTIRKPRGDGPAAQTSVRFPSGVEATIYEPRDYETGRLLVGGSAGCITDYPLQGRNVIELGYRRDDGRYCGMAVDGEAVEVSGLDRAFNERLHVHLPDPSLRTSLKIRGFMELVSAVRRGDRSLRYPASATLYDVFSLAIVEKTGFFSDQRLGGHISVFERGLRAIASLAR